MIYLDYAATTPMSDKALHVYQEAAKKMYGNASSLHDVGTNANHALNVCRAEMAQMINGEEEGIYFTGSGSEANILALRSLIEGNRKQLNHFITTEAEHSSVYHFFKQLEKAGDEVTYLQVDATGRISLEQLQQAIRPNTVLASIHHANSEIGTIQSIVEIGQILHDNDVIFHADCVQTFGEIPIDVKACFLDSVSVSSHKIYGPKGVGFCYINPNVHWQIEFPGTTHESGFRPGTVDVPGILAFTTAAQEMMEEMKEQQEKFKRLRNRFIDKLKAVTDHVVIEGDDVNQLDNIIGLSFLQAQGQYIMLECNRYGVAISTGTACQVGEQNPSRTMMSLGKTEDEAKQLVRVSFGKKTTEAEVDEAINVLKKIVSQL